MATAATTPSRAHLPSHLAQDKRFPGATAPSLHDGVKKKPFLLASTCFAACVRFAELPTDHSFAVANALRSPLHDDEPQQ